MNILILNGSPRPKGCTAQMIEALTESAQANGHQVVRIDAYKKNVRDCLGCEYCHNKGAGACVQKDDMQEIYAQLADADVLVLASPIYYHGMTGQLKCIIDRLYAVAYPKKPERLKKVAMLLSSGDPDMYDGALFSFKGDFLGFLGLEDLGVYTCHGGNVETAVEQLRALGASL